MDEEEQEERLGGTNKKLTSSPRWTHTCELLQAVVTTGCCKALSSLCNNPWLVTVMPVMPVMKSPSLVQRELAWRGRAASEGVDSPLGRPARQDGD